MLQIFQHFRRISTIPITTIIGTVAPLFRFEQFVYFGTRVSVLNLALLAVGVAVLVELPHDAVELRAQLAISFLGGCQTHNVFGAKKGRLLRLGGTTSLGDLCLLGLFGVMFGSDRDMRSWMMQMMGQGSCRGCGGTVVIG